MTSSLEQKLRALVAKWRTQEWFSTAHRLFVHRRDVALACADELEALLAERQEPPASDYIHIEAAARRGLFAWRDKPHNAKWWKKIDGTPIPNDLIVCVAQEITRMLAAAEPSSGTGERK